MNEQFVNDHADRVNEILDFYEQDRGAQEIVLNTVAMMAVTDEELTLIKDENFTSAVPEFKKLEDDFDRIFENAGIDTSALDF